MTEADKYIPSDDEIERLQHCLQIIVTGWYLGEDGANENGRSRAIFVGFALIQEAIDLMGCSMDRREEARVWYQEIEAKLIEAMKP